MNWGDHVDVWLAQHQAYEFYAPVWNSACSRLVHALLEATMMPAISRYMTKQPWTIARSASLADAHALMRKHHVRHLPVIDNGELVGIVSLGDLHLLETIAEFKLDQVSIDDAMTERPFVVTGDMPLDEVAEVMASKKYGSAIVVGREGVEGIFTTVDACRALASILQYAQLDEITATD